MNIDNGRDIRIWSIENDATAKEPTWTHIQNHTNKNEGSTRPPTGNDSDGALGLTAGLAAAAAVAVAF